MGIAKMKTISKMCIHDAGRLENNYFELSDSVQLKLETIKQSQRTYI